MKHVSEIPRGWSLNPAGAMAQDIKTIAGATLRLGDHEIPVAN